MVATREWVKNLLNKCIKRQNEELNTKFTISTENLSLNSKWQNWGSKVHKAGNVCNLYLNMNVKSGTNAAKESITTIPEGYRPKSDLGLTCITSSGYNFLMIISADGTIYPYDASFTTSNGSIRSIFTYLIDL